jgi:outer membrane protein
MIAPLLRRCLAVGLSITCPVSLAWGQQASLAPVKPSAPLIVRPYVQVTVPPVRVANSSRLSQLVRAGALYLTAQDAVALALENNIDIEVARYNPFIAQWRVERAEAGGALPGVPSNASQAGAVALGQGVAGSQAAAGVRIAGTGSNNGQSANATVSQIGPVTQTLDPSIQETSTFSHTTQPQPNTGQSITPVLISDTRAHSATYQQGFLTGGSMSVKYTDNYLRENSPTDVLNPSSDATLTISGQHNLLRGFGIAVNARTITVAKMNVNTSDLNFRTQVIAVVTQVLNQYYSLSSTYEDLKAKQNAAEVARAFFGNVKRQIELGSVAPPEAINAEAQVVTSQQAVVDAQATLRQQELRLKNLLSRAGTADPVLASVRIVPVDRIAIPEKDDLPPIDEMVKQARANRADLAAAKANQKASEVSALGTRNGVLPSLQVFGAATNTGLSGTARTVVAGGTVEAPDPYFVGGIGNALGQIFRRNFPTQRIGAFYQAPIRNWQAQADYEIDQLQLRQTELNNQKDLNQVEVDVMNYVVALQQARARYDAAVKNHVLQQGLFKGEQRKFELGSSIPYNVIQQQRDLITGQSAETAALVTYSNARIALDQVLGRTLEVNHISITEAVK